jgi:soluble lytic murein transglycosylase
MDKTRFWVLLVYHTGLKTALTRLSLSIISTHMVLQKSLTALLLIAIIASCSPQIGLSPTSSPSPTTTSGTPVAETPIPSATPSPTPTPEIRVLKGDQALFDGDYDKARTEYQTALITSTDVAVMSAALWGLGKTEYAIKDYSGALDYLRQLTNQYPTSSNSNRAYFLQGEIFMHLERYTDAAEAYTIYLALRPHVLDSFVQERRGDAYDAASDYANAIEAYQVALSSPHLGGDSSLQGKIAKAYFNKGDFNTALEIYDSIINTTTNDYLKAQMDLLSGQIYLSLGQTDQAYQRFLHAVDNYPLAYDSYSALVALVNANVPVDDLNRGLVDYFAGQYGYALDAFSRFLSANPQNDGTAVYYKALTLYQQGNYEEAVGTWKSFIDNYPDNPHWVDAWNGSASLPGIAYTQWYWLGMYDSAEQTLQTFLQLAPNDASAPEFLMDIARLQERGGKLEDAAATWKKVADQYPNNELVPQALFWAGITQYRLRNYNDALVTFQRDAILSTTTEDQARAYFWIGKAQQILGDHTAAQAIWQQTASIDPTDYYSLRAQDMLLNRQAFQPIAGVNFNVDWAKEKKDAEAWIRVTFKLSTDTDLSSPGALLSDPRLIRGTEMLTLGLDDEAQSEFDDLRTSIENDPANCYRLGNYLLELGLYYPAIFSFRQILTLAGMTTQVQTLAAPAYFNHVRYGLYYQDLILPAAKLTGLDPIFIFSVVRQESLFNKDISSPYAIGLMQITPSTGQLIADNLGWPPNYSTDDLYRPLISIGLGTTYLMTQRNNANGDLYTVLASYNAGPQASPIWRDLSGSDSDLFLEVIRYEETRDYIRGIYEIYCMYRSLYGTSP